MASRLWFYCSADCRKVEQNTAKLILVCRKCLFVVCKLGCKLFLKERFWIFDETLLTFILFEKLWTQDSIASLMPEISWRWSRLASCSTNIQSDETEKCVQNIILRIEQERTWKSLGKLLQSIVVSWLAACRRMLVWLNGGKMAPEQTTCKTSEQSTGSNWAELQAIKVVNTPQIHTPNQLEAMQVLANFRLQFKAIIAAKR